MQEKIYNKINTSILPDIAERNTALLIKQDLISLNQDWKNIPIATDLPPVEYGPQAFGVFYVLEGSTPGGRMIRKMLLQHPGPDISEDQVQFFNGYGKRRAKKWKTFQKVLNKQTEEQEIIDSARAGFVLFQKWIKKILYGISFS